MVTIISLLLIMIGIGLYVLAIDDALMLDDKKNAEIKELAIYLMIGGLIILLINSWIIKPIIVIFGG